MLPKSTYNSSSDVDLRLLVEGRDLGLSGFDPANAPMLVSALFENFPGGLSVFDPERRLIAYNRGFKDLHQNATALFDADVAPTLTQLLRLDADRGDRWTDADGAALSVEALTQAPLVYECERPNGVFLDVRQAPLDDGGLFVIHVDATERRRPQRQLKALVDNYPGGICLYDSDCQMALHNDQLQQLLEIPDAFFKGDAPSLEEMFRFNAERGEYGDGDVEALVAERMARAARREPHEYERRRPNGVVLNIRGVPIDDGGFLTTYHDVTEKRRDQELIAHMAHHDALTDLPNRLLLADRLNQAFASARRGRRFALVFLDLDRFKPVNDDYGHAIGDDLLKMVAERLLAATRDADTVARVGGDEFILLAADIDENGGADVLAKRLNEVVARPFNVGPLKIEISASIGVAIAPEHGLEADRLMTRADAALYAAKDAGRNTYRMFGADA